MMFYLKLYALTVPVFFAIDMVWLGYVAKGFYQQNLAQFLSPNVNWSAALLFYLLYIAGILTARAPGCHRHRACVVRGK